MTIDTRYDTCVGCAADGQCAIVAGQPFCGDCGASIADAAGDATGELRELQNKLDSAEAAAREAEDEASSLEDDLEDAERRARAAEDALAAQEKLAKELAERNERLRSFMLEADRARFDALEATP